ncbi:MAG: hypothetical protein JSV61_02465 [Anaerolineales bacterium]|nr:MAG: hypothetical protein JSV61_02465 [Anaerolineales bacterium]
MLETLENPTEEVKREVVRLLVDHIVVEDDAIIVHHIVPIYENERLSHKRYDDKKPLYNIRRTVF